MHDCRGRGQEVRVQGGETAAETGKRQWAEQGYGVVVWDEADLGLVSLKLDLEGECTSCTGKTDLWACSKLYHFDKFDSHLLRRVGVRVTVYLPIRRPYYELQIRTQPLDGLQRS